jgi:hypothetical protein
MNVWKIARRVWACFGPSIFCNRPCHLYPTKPTAIRDRQQSGYWRECDSSPVTWKKRKRPRPLSHGTLAEQPSPEVCPPPPYLFPRNKRMALTCAGIVGEIAIFRQLLFQPPEARPVEPRFNIEHPYNCVFRKLGGHRLQAPNLASRLLRKFHKVF